MAMFFHKDFVDAGRKSAISELPGLVDIFGQKPKTLWSIRVCSTVCQAGVFEDSKLMLAEFNGYTMEAVRLSKNAPSSAGGFEKVCFFFPEAAGFRLRFGFLARFLPGFLVNPSLGVSKQLELPVMGREATPTFKPLDQRKPNRFFFWLTLGRNGKNVTMSSGQL